MTIRGKAAAVSYSIVALISVVLGSIYLVSSQFMPYHAAALGTSWVALEPAEQTLILALMRVSGGGGDRRDLIVCPQRRGHSRRCYKELLERRCFSIAYLSSGKYR
jgi:hypothetical protein